MDRKERIDREINDILRVNGVIAGYRMAWIVAGSTC
jgi:hypothetical protein